MGHTDRKDGTPRGRLARGERPPRRMTQLCSREARLALGIDVGTSGVKVVLLDEAGRIVRAAQSAYSVDSPRPGCAQTKPDSWIAASRQALHEACAGVDLSRLAGVGIDGQMHAMLLLDDDGKPVRPAMLWPDSRAAAQTARWRALPSAVLGRLANPVVPGMTGPMLRWLKDSEPEAYARGTRLAAAKDYVRNELVPGLWTDVTDASATLLWDVVAGDWAHDVVTGVGLEPALLPEVREPEELAGVIAADAAAAWGLPAGLPVSIGCSDVAATLLGAFASPERSTLVVGTGAQVLRPGVQPVADPAPRSHTYRGVGMTYAMAAIQNAGLALHWVCRVLEATWDDLYAAVPRTPGPDGSVDVTGPAFLPYLSGERAPVPVRASHGEWTGLGLETDRTALLRAAAEGVVFAIRESLALLPAAPDPQIDLTGGGARAPQLRQLVADALGRPVRPVDVPEVTAAGAALLGWRAAGRADVRSMVRYGEVVEPRPNMTVAYDALFERFLAAARARRNRA